LAASEQDSSQLIENSNIPDLERLAMQEMLNVMTRRGELSGPAIKEDGKDSSQYQDRLREREARMTILDSTIETARPVVADFKLAREADQLVIDQARAELPFIPEGEFAGYTPKDACIKKLRDLESVFRSKWDLGAAAVATINLLLANPPLPGSLLLEDGRFAYAALGQHLANQKGSEEALANVVKADPDFLALKERVDAYRLAIMAGLGVGRASASTPSAMPQAPSEAPRPGPAPRPAPKTPAPLPPDPVEAAFLAWCLEVAPLPPAAQAELMAAFESEGAELDDRRIGFLATTLALADPAALTPELADRLDERGLQELARVVTEPELAGLLPRLRMAIVKQLTTRGGKQAEARGIFAGAFAAALVREHPKALSELLENTVGPNKSAVMTALTKQLSDQEITDFGRETLHAIYKSVGTPITEEARRQSARLVRLANRK
jgi:hypothetical protein